MSGFGLLRSPLAVSWQCRINILIFHIDKPFKEFILCHISLWKGVIRVCPGIVAGAGAAGADAVAVAAVGGFNRGIVAGACFHE